MSEEYRIEKDLLGEVKIPSNAYWGSTTQRAINNFQISGRTLPISFILSLAQVKKACVMANNDLGSIDNTKKRAIKLAIDEILDERKYLDQFPIDIYQTGSGTQTNMNMNEVVANRANEILGHKKGEKYPIHPNDHVNKAQSSNDIIPTAMHVTIVKEIKNILLHSIDLMIGTLNQKIVQFQDIVKVGRTHLQDAVPIPLSLEFEVYKKQIEDNKKRLLDSLQELKQLPLGGTAVGTGINAPRDFAEKAIKHLNMITTLDFSSNPLQAEGIASHNAVVHLHSNLKTLALSLMKMANDIRLLGSGPRAGLAELQLPANEPGSSIMPGKINPTQSEMLIQVALTVLGNDITVSMAEGYGSMLDLNVTKPLMIHNLLESLTLLSNGIKSFTKKLLEGLKVNKEKIEQDMSRSLMLVTNLTKKIGYDKASKIAMKAYETGKTIKEVAMESDLGITEKEIDELLDYRRMI